MSARIDPIRMSVVELVERKRSILRMKGVDVLDGTPLIRVKPYVSSFGHRADVRIGWLQGKAETNPEPPAANARRRISSGGHLVEPASDALQGFRHAWQVRTVNFDTVLVNPESLQPFCSMA